MAEEKKTSRGGRLITSLRERIFQHRSSSERRFGGQDVRGRLAHLLVKNRTQKNGAAAAEASYGVVPEVRSLEEGGLIWCASEMS